MYQLPVGEFKSRFSELLLRVLQGESVGITYGKNRKKVAALVPYNKIGGLARVKLGLLKGKVSFSVHKDFKITDEELLRS